MRFVVPAVFLVGALAGAGAWASTQAITPRPVAPVVLSGPDIGFRMVARKGSTAVGQLVVRVDGEWVETESAMVTRPVVVK